MTEQDPLRIESVKVYEQHEILWDRHVMRIDFKFTNPEKLEPPTFVHLHVPNKRTADRRAVAAALREMADTLYTEPKP